MKDAARRFCGALCKNKFHLQAASAQLPDGFVLAKAAEMHADPCPKCQGDGPIDIHTSYTVWSAVVITRWADKPELSCEACARTEKIRAAASAGLFGWWGFPWGLLITPVQIIRNLVGVLKHHDSSKPSGELVEIVRRRLSAQLIQDDAVQLVPIESRASA